MVDKYDDLDYLITMLYDFVYMDNKEKCYMVKYIGKNDITQDNIKRTNKVKQYIKNIFTDNKFKFVDNINGVYELKRYSDASYPSSVFLYNYNKDGALDDLTRWENVSKIISFVLSEMVVTREFNNVVLPILNIDIEKGDLDDFIKTMPELKELKDGYISVEIREHYYKMCSLDNYLKNNSEKMKTMHWKILLFQVLFSLAIIQKKYPTFRHNDLDLNNIYVYQRTENDEKVKYNLNGTIFDIPNVGFTIKIGNFYKSVIDGFVDNKSLDAKMKKMNRYYDFNYFMKKIFNYIKSDDKLKEFIDDVFPEKMRGNDKYLDNEFVLPDEIIKSNKFFKDLITKKIETVPKKESFEQEPSIEDEDKQPEEKSKYDELPEDVVENPLNDSQDNIQGKRRIAGKLEKIFRVKSDDDQIGSSKSKDVKNEDSSDSPFIDRLIDETKNDIVKKNNMLGNNIMNSIPLGIPYTSPEQIQGIKSNYMPPGMMPQPNYHPEQVNQIIGQLPPGYNGPIPDHLANQLNMPQMPPQMQQMQQMPQQMQQMQQMPQQMDEYNLSQIMQQGGSNGKIVQPFEEKSLKNTPFKTQDQAEVEIKRSKEIKQPKPNEPLIQFQVNDSLLKAGQAPPASRVVYPSPYVPIPNPYYPQMANPMYPWQYTPYNVPVIKSYKIDMPTPAGGHMQMSNIYEDMLPGPIDFINTFNSLGERMMMYNFVRSVLIKQSDGEDISMAEDKSGPKDMLNIFSYIKLMDLNPYHNDRIGLNPYIDLPDNMLLYRSCYPIRLDPSTNLIMCAKNSIGINIRIYDMTIGELNIAKLTKSIGYQNFDLWREIAYYEYIREEVIKKKVCPNFVTLYSYFISPDSGIDFKKLKLIKNKGRDYKPREEERQLEFNKKLNDDYLADLAKQVQEQIMDQKLPLNSALQDKDKYGLPAYVDPKDIYADGIAKGPLSDINKGSRKCLLALTEAPSMNLFSWATRTYEQNGPIKRMIATGYHKSEIWRSVIFQIMAACYVLYKRRIAFTEFSIMNNIYIRDLRTDANVVGYWKYKIDGIDYYVPNYGYLVMIDSNYKDIPGADYTILKTNDNKIYKIYSDIYMTDGKKLDKDKLNKKLLKNFANVVDPNNFSKDFTNYGGIKPPEDIIALLSAIFNEINTARIPNIEHYIRKYMSNYMHNRIGTLLQEPELPYILDDNRNVKKGDLVVYEIQKDRHLYMFALFCKKLDGNKCVILTKSSPQDETITTTEAHMEMISKYSPLYPIEQIYKPNEAKLAEDDLIETYVM